MATDAGKMTPQHHATMFRRLMTTGVVMIDCKNPEDHDQEPYARFYWRVKQAVKKSGFRVRGKLIGGTKHQVTLVQLCRQLLERFKS